MNLREIYEKGLKNPLALLILRNNGINYSMSKEVVEEILKQKENTNLPRMQALRHNRHEDWIPLDYSIELSCEKCITVSRTYDTGMLFEEIYISNYMAERIQNPENHNEENFNMIINSITSSMYDETEAQDYFDVNGTGVDMDYFSVENDEVLIGVSDLDTRDVDMIKNKILEYYGITLED